MIFIFSFLLMNTASGFLGEFDFNKCVQLKTISNATSVNISTISYPNSTQLIINAQMTKNNKNFNYTFCKTNVEGIYIYDYFDNEGHVFENSFKITKGEGIGLTNINFSKTENIVILIILVVIIVFLCVYGLFLYASGLTIVTGFILLGSGISLLISGITIIAGVIIAFIPSRR